VWCEYKILRQSDFALTQLNQRCNLSVPSQDGQGGLPRDTFVPLYAGQTIIPLFPVPLHIGHGNGFKNFVPLQTGHTNCIMYQI